jgi:hypothetical protein
MTYMDMIENFDSYICLQDFNETFEYRMPTLSAHNIVAGTPYVDIGGVQIVKI